MNLNSGDSFVSRVKRQAVLEHQLSELNQKEDALREEIQRSSQRIARIVLHPKFNVELADELYDFKLHVLEITLAARKRALAHSQSIHDQQEAKLDEVQAKLTS